MAFFLFVAASSACVCSEAIRSGSGVFSYCVENASEVAGVNTDEELEAIREYLLG